MDPKTAEKFEKTWQRPEETVKAWKEKTGGKAVGLALVDVPEELVWAAGALPVSILARDVSFQNVDKHLQQFACSYSRTVVELAESNELDYLDGLIMPYACDTTRCMDLIFKYMDRFDFYECARIPRRDGAAGVEKYYNMELKRMAANLSAFTGKKVDEASLSDAIKAYNRVRDLLQKMREAVRKGAEGITPTEYFSAVRAAMVMAPDDAAALLEEAVSQIGDGKSNGMPTVVVAGKLPEPPELIGVLTGAGLHLLEDHLAVGGRWIEAKASEGGDPWEAIVSRQIGRLPFSGIWSKRENRASYLMERVKELSADGAIFLVQKFCEIAELDYPGIKEELEKEGVPLLSIETDFRRSSLEGVKTRVEAFAEMLRENKG